MGKTFDIHRFREDVSYKWQVKDWAYEGNLSLFDTALWVREWFDDPISLPYGSDDSAYLEVIMQMWTKLQWTVHALYDILDEAYGCCDLQTRDVVSSIIAEIDGELEALDEYLWG